ncbi:MAG: hypothetical protein NC336_06535 [Clostridium sp.]|nr:hypothetical protein [Clostridium sp.]
MDILHILREAEPTVIDLASVFVICVTIITCIHILANKIAEIVSSRRAVSEQAEPAAAPATADPKPSPEESEKEKVDMALGIVKLLINTDKEKLTEDDKRLRCYAVNCLGEYLGQEAAITETPWPQS